MIVSWDIALIFAVLGILIPWRGAVRVRKLLARPQVTGMDRLVIYASTIAFQWLLAGIVVWRCFVHGISADELGLPIRSPAATLIWAAALVVGLGSIQYIGIRRTAQVETSPPSRLREISLRLMPGSLIEALVFGALAITASVCEEFLYRGFVFAVLFASTGSVAFAIAGSSLLFSLAHIYQGPRGLVSTLIFGLILAASRYFTGNLLPAMAAHLVVDLMAGLLAARYLKTSQPSPELVEDLHH
jgi:membrane protease YdiL (CAAX protease family)